MDDFFAELEAEIAIHTQKAQIKKDAVAAKKRANDRTKPEAERLRSLAEWREYQAILDAEIWRPVSLVAFFTEQQCDGCGSVHRVFLQYMEQQAHRNKRDQRRWIRVSHPEPHLTRETLIQCHRTHVCADCVEDHGFEFINASRFAMPGPITVSGSYTQGDINAQNEIDRPTASVGSANSELVARTLA